MSFHLNLNPMNFSLFSKYSCMVLDILVPVSEQLPLIHIRTLTNMYSFKSLPTPVSGQLSLKQAKYRFKLCIAW